MVSRQLYLRNSKVFIDLTNCKVKIINRVFFMQKDSVVEIDYTGRIALSNEVFDTTVEKNAVDAGIFDEKAKYGPVAIIVGAGDLLKGLDNAVLEMHAGEQRKIRLNPGEGFGERRHEMISVVPLQKFREKKIAPAPGLIVELNGQRGRVQSVSGGRVRVDFNHPLAGKELEYEIKVIGEIKKPREKIEAFYNKYFGMVPETEKKLKVLEKSVEVSLSPRWSANLGPLKKLFSERVNSYVKGYGSVKFVEEFREEKAKSKEEADKK